VSGAADSAGKSAVAPADSTPLQASAPTLTDYFRGGAALDDAQPVVAIGRSSATSCREATLLGHFADEPVYLNTREPFILTTFGVSGGGKSHTLNCILEACLLPFPEEGIITLLGRGAVCINTGGEKVFPEEVEEALKLDAAVADAVVVGVPDEKFGEAIVGVVEALPGSELDHEGLIAHVKEHLAHYKAPKQIVAIDTIGRAPNGKVDYKRMKAYALDVLGITAD
jgi:hypothetical protein